MKLDLTFGRKQDGFTLLELLLSIGILAVILAIASSAMGSYSRILGSITDERTNLHEARLAMGKITDVAIGERSSRNLALQLDGTQTILQGTVGGTVYDLVRGTPSGSPNGAELYLNTQRELRDKNNNLIAQYIYSIDFQNHVGSQVAITPLSGDPIQVPPDAKFIKIIVKADKNQDDNNSCTIDTLLHYK